MFLKVHRTLKHVCNENYKKSTLFPGKKIIVWEDLNYKHIKEKSSAIKPPQISHFLITPLL